MYAGLIELIKWHSIPCMSWLSSPVVSGLCLSGGFTCHEFESLNWQLFVNGIGLDFIGLKVYGAVHLATATFI